MATTVTYFSPRQGREAVAYDLSESVGVGGRNLPNDVRLVQTLLQIVFYIHPSATNPGPPGETGIAVDGKFGTHTHAHIRQFKASMRQRGFNTPPDGKIDAFAGHPYKKTRSGGTYVQAMLNNVAYARCEHAGRVNDFVLDGPRSTDAFDVDEDLRLELKANRRMELDGYPDGPIPL